MYILVSHLTSSLGLSYIVTIDVEDIIVHSSVTVALPVGFLNGHLQYHWGQEIVYR
mgnify:CR=1 FL=1